jgi:Zn-dependent protease with chaperone function
MKSMKRQSSMGFRCLMALWLLTLSIEALAQTQVKPGFNLFSPQQDIEIGKQSATEVERQMPMLRDRSVQQYVSEVGHRLAAASPGPKYPFQFKVVDVSDINAFALPGGFMYVNRGLIDAVQTEGELAGVMAHEMAHVVLRHGTNQASKAYLAQAGLSVLGGVLGGGGALGQVIGAVGGFGLNTLFLKFSRNAEEQADVVGAQMLAKAGYDPMDMVSMFEMLRKQGGHDPGKVEQFFSDHPAPANRAERIRKEAKLLGSVRETRPVGGFEQVKAELHRLPPATSMQQIARRQAPQGGGYPQGNGRTADIRVERPSSRMRSFEQRNGFFRIDYPENWRPYEDNNGYGVTLVPEGGVASTGNGQQSIIYGVIVNHYTPFEGSMEDGSYSRNRRSRNRVNLEDATNDLINQLTQSNSYLRPVDRSERRQSIDGENALSVVLSGRSPITGQEERVTLFTRELADGHVIYSLFIAPGQDYDELSRTFQRMISSLRVNDEVAHR